MYTDQSLNPKACATMYIARNHCKILDLDIKVMLKIEKAHK